MRESRLATLAVVTLVLLNQAQVGIMRAPVLLQPRLVQRHPGQERGAVLVAPLHRVPVLGGDLHRQRHLRVRHPVRPDDPLAAVADRPLRQRVAEATARTTAWRCPAASPTTRTSASRSTSTASSTSTYGFSIRLLATVSSLVSFSIILWTISAGFTFPGTDIVIPGLLFWVALVYAGVGTLITHSIGRALVPLNFDQQRYEADFRFSLARLREYAEQVALLEGEKAERQIVMGRFGWRDREFLAAS